MKRAMRVLVPSTLLVAGVCALVYGNAVRHVPVLTEVMVEKDTIILERPPANWPGNTGGGRFGPGGPALPPPPPRPKRVKAQVAEEQLLPTREPQLVREVTVGGVARQEDGSYKLTHRAGEAGPALCPT